MAKKKSEEIDLDDLEKELEEVMNPENYIGTAVEQVEKVVKRLK